LADLIDRKKKHPANVRPIIEIDEANFETEVLKSSQPVLVEFATGWSLPSVMFDGAMDEISTELIEDLKLATVKLDRNPNLGLWYGIRCVPTVMYFLDGEVRIGIFGTASKETILSQLRPIMNSSTNGQISNP
jgi:thioredoxin 1